VNFPFETNRTLLIAPTGWGKTTLLLGLLIKSKKTMVFYSPLRALADEFFKRAQEEGVKCFCPQNRKAMRAGIEHNEFDLLIITYELIDDTSLGYLIDQDYFHVIDEVHLNLIWGKGFRPILQDVLDILLHYSDSLLMLTATCSNELEQYINQTSSLVYSINIKNFALKKSPQNIFTSLNKKELVKNIEMIHQKRTLVFCQYRKEVEYLTSLFKSKDYHVLGCVSGGVDYFRSMLLKRDPDFIFATSTLSHGVNLPQIDNIIILYPIENKELWIQMIGRAGRRGEDFNVYQMNLESYEQNSILKGLLKWYVFKKLLMLKGIIRGIRRHSYS